MGLRKILGAALATGTQLVPFLNLFGPIATAVIPGDKDDKVLAKVGSELAQFNAIVANMEGLGILLADKNISGADKARAAGAQMGQVVLQSMQAGGYKLNDEPKFKEACSRLGGDWADIMECFKK